MKINEFNRGIATGAVLLESKNHMEEFIGLYGLQDERIEGIEGCVTIDENFNVLVRPARDGDGYEKNGIPVVCAKQTVEGCAAYHGTVIFIRKGSQ